MNTDKSIEELLVDIHEQERRETLSRFASWIQGEIRACEDEICKADEKLKLVKPK